MAIDFRGHADNAQRFELLVPLRPLPLCACGETRFYVNRFTQMPTMLFPRPRVLGYAPLARPTTTIASGLTDVLLCKTQRAC